MKRLFVDSDFLVGLFNSNDKNHTEARRISDGLDVQETELWISNLIRQESATVVSHRIGMDATRDFVKHILADVNHVVIVDEHLEKDAWGIFLRQKKKGCSFVDCANLAVIKKYNLDGILAFDGFYPKNLKIV